MKLLRLCRNQWDRTSAVVLVVAGLVALFAGWAGAQGSIFTFQQIPYLMSGGLFGVVLVVLGATCWLSADMRDEWRKLDGVEEALRGHEPAGHTTSVGAAEARGPDARDQLVEPALGRTEGLRVTS